MNLTLQSLWPIMPLRWRHLCEPVWRCLRCQCPSGQELSAHREYIHRHGQPADGDHLQPEWRHCTLQMEAVCYTWGGAATQRGVSHPHLVFLGPIFNIKQATESIMIDVRCVSNIPPFWASSMLKKVRLIHREIWYLIVFKFYCSFICVSAIICVPFYLQSVIHILLNSLLAKFDFWHNCTTAHLPASTFGTIMNTIQKELIQPYCSTYPIIQYQWPDCIACTLIIPSITGL